MMQAIFTETIEQAFIQVGLEAPKINGSKILRFSTNGSNLDKAGWLRLFDDNKGAVFGDWRTGDVWCWQQANDGERKTAEEIRELKRMGEEQRAKAEEERRQAYAEAAKKAQGYIDECQPATMHPYLERKQIKGLGALAHGESLVIPVVGPDGVQSLQRIDADGGKKFMQDGKISGGSFTIGEPTSTLVIAEGFATAASIHMATGFQTVVAFNAGNLKPVATLLRSCHQDVEIVIAGDNDPVGIKKATEAANEVGGVAVFPEGVNDFNDLACTSGLESVKESLLGAQAPLPIGYDASSVNGEFTAPDYLIKGVLNRGDLSVTFGDSGSMKSFVELDKALRMGMGWAWNGHKVKRAFTLIVLGEGAGGYRRRIRAWLQHHNLLNSKDQPWVWVIDKAAELYSNPKGMQDWIRAVERHTKRKVDHVLIDTLNTNMGKGADENDAVAVGSMLGFTREAANSAAITFVHHVGHGDKGRERGSYAIRGNMDNRTLVERDMDGKGQIITVSSLKIKDGEEFTPVNMTYEVVVLGIDEEGDKITSLVMVPTEEEPQSPLNGFKGRGSKRMDIIMGLLREAGGRMSYVELRNKFKEANPKDGKNFSAGVRECFVQGLINDYQPMGHVIVIGTS